MLLDVSGGGITGERLSEVLVSIGLGAVTAWATARTRIALLEYRVTQTEELGRSLVKKLDGIEKRQMQQLELSAAIAHKVGIVSRSPGDVLTRYLSEDVALSERGE